MLQLTHARYLLGQDLRGWRELRESGLTLPLKGIKGAETQLIFTKIHERIREQHEGGRDLTTKYCKFKSSNKKSMPWTCNAGNPGGFLVVKNLSLKKICLGLEAIARDMTPKPDGRKGRHEIDATIVWVFL